MLLDQITIKHLKILRLETRQKEGKGLKESVCGLISGLKNVSSGK